MREYQITVNGIQWFLVWKRQRKMRFGIGALFWCSQKTYRKMPIEGKMQENSNQTQRVTIYCILFRVSNSFFFRMHLMRPVASTPERTHTHQPKLSYLIWFVRSWCSFCVFFCFCCIGLHQTKRNSRYSCVFIRWTNSFWVLHREHKWKPRAQWALDLRRLWFVILSQ